MTCSVDKSNFGPVTLRWVLQMMNSILKSHEFPKLWGKSKGISILKPGNYFALRKSYTVTKTRLKSRSSFMHDTDELIESPSTRRIELWYNHIQYVPYKLMQTPNEPLASGACGTWLEWKWLDRLRQTQHEKWKYIEDDDTTCEYKEADQTMDFSALV